MEKANWGVSEYLKHFEDEIGRAVEERFKDKFRELTGEMALLDSEFLVKKHGCGGPLDDLLERFHSISGRLGYCERPRGFENDCDKLYADIEEAVAKVKAFRSSCEI